MSIYSACCCFASPLVRLLPQEERERLLAAIRETADRLAEVSPPTALFAEKFFGDRKDFLAAVRELTSLPSVRQYFALYPLDVEILMQGVRQLRAMNDRNIQDMDITRKELEDCVVSLDYSADVMSRDCDAAVRGGASE